MIVNNDILALHPVAVAVPPPPPRPAIAPAGERESANDRRGAQKDGRSTGLSFRATLTATTVGGLGAVVDRAPSVTSDSGESSAAQERAVKLPENGPIILSSHESERLYREARAEKPFKRDPAFVAATQRYAKSYFSVSGTYARPGEALELTV